MLLGPTFFSVSFRLGTILALAQTGGAAEPFVWKWAKGDTARYQLTQSMRMNVDAGDAGRIESSARNDTITHWNVKAVAGDGTATLSQKTERAVMVTEGPAGQGFRYDSADDQPPAGMATLVAPLFEALCEHEFEMAMAPRGKIDGVVLSDNLAEVLDELPGGAVSTEMLTQTTKLASLVLPEQSLELGDQWTSDFDAVTPQAGKIRVTVTYTYQGIDASEGRELEAIAAEMAVSLADQSTETGAAIETKSSDGKFLFDRETGRLIRSRLSQVLEIKANLNGQEFVSQVQQSVAMRSLAEGEEPVLTDPEQAEEPAATLAE